MSRARVVHIPQIECYFRARDVAYGRQSDPGALAFPRNPGLRVIPGRLRPFLCGDACFEADIRNSHPSLILPLLRSILPNAESRYPRIAIYIGTGGNTGFYMRSGRLLGEICGKLPLVFFTGKHSGRGVNRQVRTMRSQAGSAVSAGRRIRLSIA